MFETLAIVLARAGSKRLPNKNKLNLLGRPMISYTFDAAKNCSYIDKVIVSSDDPEIKVIAESQDIEFIWRPKDLATDSAKSADCIVHALKYLESRGEVFRNFVLLQPTSPLRNSQHLTDCMANFIASDAKTTISVTEVFPHPQNFYQILNDELISLNTDLTDDVSAWAPNGAIYGARVNDFLSSKLLNQVPCLPFRMTKEESCDVDYYWQFKACEIIIEMNKKINRV